MMKKRKIALALGLCTVVGLSAVGLAACGEKPAKPGSKSEYYIVGLSSSDIFGGELDWGKQHKDTVAEIPDAVNFKTTKTSNVYELTVDLYENDEFQIVIAGKGWTGQMGYEVLASDQQADGVIEIPGGGTNSNFKLDKDGRYTFTLTVNGEGANKVTYTRTDDQAKLPRVVLNKSALVLTAGGEETLTATLKDTETPVVWSSDKPEIATVDPATGKVTGISAGKAVITAKSGDATASCTVTVAKAAVNYYLRGSSVLDYFGWGAATELDKINENILFVADETKKDTYVLTTNLYKNTEFKIAMFGAADENGWDGSLGYGNLDADTKAKSFVADNNGNIKITQDGSYKITIVETTTPADSETHASVKKEAKIERVGDAPEFALQKLAVGLYGGMNNWKGVNVDATKNGETFTAEFTVECEKGQGFQIRTFSNQEAASIEGEATSYIDKRINGTSATVTVCEGVDFGSSTDTSGDCKITTSGKYKFTLTFNLIGECTSLTVVTVTA